jgi:hypothetical protein
VTDLTGICDCGAPLSHPRHGPSQGDHPFHDSSLTVAEELPDDVPDGDVGANEPDEPAEEGNHP